MVSAAAIYTCATGGEQNFRGAFGYFGVNHTVVIYAATFEGIAFSHVGSERTEKQLNRG
jgi:hypothetical protein